MIINESILVLGVFIGSVVITALLRHYALNKNILDIPNNRSSHNTPTPSVGGLSIVITFSIYLLILLLFDRINIDIFMALFGGGVFVALIGFWDDRVHIAASKRIIVHIISALWALFWIGAENPGVSAIGLLNLGWFVDIAALFLMVWLLNLYNFMDGIDGIAGSEAIFVMGATALILIAGTTNSHHVQFSSNWEIQSIMYLLIGLGLAVSGFLVWNWPPAKIFMGDVGSGYLGFILAVIAISTAINNIINIWTWLILLGVFIVDATTTLCRRFLSRQRWYEAHRNHAYQHAAQKYKSHMKVTLSILIINTFWLLPLAWLAAYKKEWGAILTMCAYMPLTLLALNLRAGKEE
jgi:Fuc2NAc and GlcNAc transferase